MSSCTSCGHQLGVGRFCTNCGAPVDSATPDGTPDGTPDAPPPSGDDWRTDTAERTLSQAAADPRTPPAAVAPPPPPRYPLFADEVEGYTPYGPLTTTTSEPTAEPEVAAAEDADRAGARGVRIRIRLRLRRGAPQPGAVDPRGRAGAGADHGRLVVPGP